MSVELQFVIGLGLFLIVATLLSEYCKGQTYAEQMRKKYNKKVKDFRDQPR